MSKVLIIEDDAAYRKIYARKFEVSGYSVQVAENGAEGLEKMRAFMPDIVFLDVMMPKMDGFQVLNHAKINPAIQGIPVVVITNLSTGDDNQKLIQKGAAAVVVKSDTEPNAIVAKAAEVISKSNAKGVNHGATN